MAGSAIWCLAFRNNMAVLGCGSGDIEVEIIDLFNNFIFLFAFNEMCLVKTLECMIFKTFVYCLNRGTIIVGNKFIDNKLSALSIILYFIL